MADHQLQKWDLVSPINHQGTLASGCGRWTEAVVVQAEPFILVCQDGDMCWYSHKAENFFKVGTASPDDIRQIERRIDRDDHLKSRLIAGATQ